jgi:tripartite-type tricarboxylate transporter receptor subunit TctC
VRSGRLIALGVTTPYRAKALPEVPTIAESGVPGYELGSWYGLLVPNRTPAPLIAHLNREVSETMNAPDVKEKLSADGAEAAPPNSPQQFRGLIDAEIVRWGKVIKTLGLKERGDGR